MKEQVLFIMSALLLTLFSPAFVLANTYITDIYFTLPDTVYTINESIGLKGYIYQANFTDSGTLVTNFSAISSSNVNLTIRNTNGTIISNYTFTTDSAGAFYSRSNFYTTAPNVTSPSTSGNYYIRAEYKDPNNLTSFSEIETVVVNQTMDTFSISSEKAIYNPSETVSISAEAVRLIGDKILYVANASINGSLRNSTKSVLQAFNCTTGSNGKCAITLTAPADYGNYVIELNNFKTFSSFSVVPFSYNSYMKDELGKGFKNVFALGEQARIEVKINNASNSEVYAFSGYIASSSGDSIKTITSTTLNNNNSFTNTFLFTVDSTTFSYGAYSAHITVTKTGDGSIDSLISFEVQDWMLSVKKKEYNSGFEYEYSVFPNKTLRFEALPTYRSNGSIIAGINSTSFNITLKDNLNNILASTSASWNISCGKSGCYEFSLNSSSNTGKYILSATLSQGGDVQIESKVINVINGVMSAQSIDKEGNIKELFGANEYVYLSINAYNQTSSQFNLSNAEIFMINYMNGSEFSYTQVSNFSLVNTSNSVYEWAWNSTLQRIKLDVPKTGGLYNLFLFGNNQTLGAESKFIVNPYDVCAVPKNTPGTVSSGYYYVWQFKTSDTIYFEIKTTQANNPSGRATALNLTGNGTGIGSACVVDTTKKQVVSNLTITLVEVKNSESGAIQNINSTSSVCKSSDTNGTTCTIEPATKWDGGVNIAKFNIQGQDGTSSVFYTKFEARAFYLYGYSATWQNSPVDNITLQLQIYEAGDSWWGNSGSSGGLSGTVTLKKVEYQGRDGEWLWPPVDSGYNVSKGNASSASITTGYGSNGITLIAANLPSGEWKTGYYRAVLQATTTAGDTDYGYAWFGIKLWDVYGSPIECTTTACNYKSYFNSKENITLFVKIAKAGGYNYFDSGGQDIWGNVTVGIKKIEDCRTWPCKELNSSQYTSNTINVNASSGWYWNSNLTSASSYIININMTTGSWNTGYYSVILDVNGTDTGYAWFNTISFYVETQPTSHNGSGYKYNIRGNQPMYFNVTTTKNYKWLSGNVRYNASDYINVTLDDAVLRTWDQQTYKSIEYTYPEDINITPNNFSGNGLINISFLNGSWPSGYYYGELILKNLDNETSTGWLWFNVQPFRVSISTTGNVYNIDSDQCVNTTLYIYESDWYSSSLFSGNYTITSVFEDIWSGYSQSRTYYPDYTISGYSNSSSFNSTANVTFCPTSGQWTGGNWGGYHYLNILVKDNVYNDTQTGWLYFRTVPFTVSWASVSGGTTQSTSGNINVSVTLTKPSGGNATGNLTKLYQWRYDNYQSLKQEYVFKVTNYSGGNACWSNVSGQCTINGTANVTIYAPAGGWKVGYNYIQAEWTNDADNTGVEDWSSIYFDGREAYNGWFSNSWYADSVWNYRHYFALNENFTISLNVRDSGYNNAGVSIGTVEYAYSSGSCWDEWCRTYVPAAFSPTFATNGQAILKIKVPTANWSNGEYYLRATVNGSGGTATITGGNVRAKDMTPPNITITSPVNNGTYNTSISFSAATDKNSQCNIYLVNYDNFYNWYCPGWNATNSSNSSSLSSQTINACNITKYDYNGSNYYSEGISNSYHHIYDGINFSSCYIPNPGAGLSCYGQYASKLTAFMTSGTTSHSATLNVSGWTDQTYGLQLWCSDSNYNYASEKVAFKVNNTV